MYLPAHFDAEDPALAEQLMREHPFASLVTNDDDGFPFVTHLPLVLVSKGRGEWTLLGHVARANPQWKQLQARPEALVVFLGPHGYVSPTVYPDRQRVPTWNYVAVHCRVRATLLPEAGTKDALLKQLIGQHEPPYAQQWRDLGEDYQRRMLAGIVAFELKVVGWQCKLKLNQHRPEAHAAMRRLHAAQGGEAAGLEAWMDRAGVGR
ncbi:transcriptional regulator [Pseudacidovorax sp. 1753]|uniref:FMN-binding negative transcriptional regulator n=1 Tax=Pseudacidovorax sp. 1753 TaxID=3156419 RepID=UPI0033947EA2